jgi:hypothetical protein
LCSSIHCQLRARIAANLLEPQFCQRLCGAISEETKLEPHRQRAHQGAINICPSTMTQRHPFCQRLLEGIAGVDITPALGNRSTAGFSRSFECTMAAAIMVFRIERLPGICDGITVASDIPTVVPCFELGLE